MTAIGRDDGQLGPSQGNPKPWNKGVGHAEPFAGSGEGTGASKIGVPMTPYVMPAAERAFLKADRSAMARVEVRFGPYDLNAVYVNAPDRWVSLAEFRIALVKALDNYNRKPAANAGKTPLDIWQR